MNSSQRNTTDFRLAPAALAAAALFVFAAALAVSPAYAAGRKKGVDVEIPYEGNVLKTPEVAAPLYLQASGHEMIVSNEAGGVFSVTMSGKTKELAGKSKLPHPAGVAIAPAGFGSYAGQVFVLNAAKDGAACGVMRVDKSGTVSEFAKLPQAGGKDATDCRDLEFGPAGTPYAGKLYAATTGNSTIYAIDSSGKAAVFGTYDKPVAWELSVIGFLPADDPKAPNSMLVGMRPRMESAAKVGRLAVIGADGKMKPDPYLVGFIAPTGFATSPGNFGSYSHVFFILDMGRPAAKGGAADGSIDRVYKGVARPFAGNLSDPTCMRFIGNRLVICDPAYRGARGEGAIVILSSLL
jgi:hypothetical protein